MSKTMSVADAKFLEWLDEDPRRGDFELDDSNLHRLRRDGFIESVGAVWRPTAEGMGMARRVLAVELEDVGDERDEATVVTVGASGGGSTDGLLA